MKVDALLIGQGLAGTLLSYSLQQQGFSVLVIDQPGITVASSVAAGLYNPITGRQMVKTWWADRLFPLIPQAYGTLEKLTATYFLKPLPIYRPFVSIAEQNDWFGRWSDPAYAPFIRQVSDRPLYRPWIKNPFGGLLLDQTGWIDIPVLLQAWKQHLQAQGVYRQEVFNEDDLQISETGIRYGNVEARRLIYCNGTAQLKSRYWGWLPLRPVKGDVLMLDSAAQLEVIPNRGVFLVPLGEGRFRSGSTYNHHDLELVPQSKDRQVIEEKLGELLEEPWQVRDHQVGVRPATKDRRPIIGRHPEHKSLFVFNGMGTKGVSLAPYCAKIFAEHLKNEAELATEIQVDRFYSLY